MENIKQETLDEIIEKIKKLEHDNAKLEARNACMNVTMKYFHYHQCIRDDLVLKECWAKTSPGIHSEHGASGVYEGYEHIAQFHEQRPAAPGKLLFHSITTPVIEVADDLKTAKGIFLLQGFESGVIREGALPEAFVCDEPAVDGKKVWAHWAFAKYGIDYILEDGEWKIWHFHAYDVTRATFDKNWVTLAQEMAKMNEEASKADMGEEAPNKIMYFDDTHILYLPKADKPTTYHFNYDGMNSQVELFPPVPHPYKTFKDTFEY